MMTITITRFFKPLLSRPVASSRVAPLVLLSVISFCFIFVLFLALMYVVSVLRADFWTYEWCSGKMGIWMRCVGSLGRDLPQLHSQLATTAVFVCALPLFNSPQISSEGWIYSFFPAAHSKHLKRLDFFALHAHTTFGRAPTDYLFKKEK